MEHAAIQEKVISILASILKISKDQINPSSNLEQLGADSLNRVEFVLALEDAFNVEISDDAAEEFSSVEQVVNYLTTVIEKN